MLCNSSDGMCLLGHQFVPLIVAIYSIVNCIFISCLCVLCSVYVVQSQSIYMNAHCSASPQMYVWVLLLCCLALFGDFLLCYRYWENAVVLFNICWMFGVCVCACTTSRTTAIPINFATIYAFPAVLRGRQEIFSFISIENHWQRRTMNKDERENMNVILRAIHIYI